MIKKPEKSEKDWLEQARAVGKFHIIRVKENPQWTQRMTAANLKYSTGYISQCLTICRFLKTSYGEELEQFELLNDALEFIKEKKREMNIREVE